MAVNLSESGVFFVGGRGDGSAAVSHAGGVTLAQWQADPTLSKYVGANGAPIKNESGVDWDNTAGAFSKIGIGLGVTVGTLVYATGTNITSCNGAKVTAVSTNIIQVAGVIATGDNADSVVVVGGAFDTLAHALTNVTPCTSYSHYILTNKDEIITAAETVTGGSLGNNAIRYILGYHTTPPSNTSMDNGDRDAGGDYYGTYTELNANGGAFPVIQAVAQDCIVMANIHATNTDKNAGNTGFWFYNNEFAFRKGIQLRNCKATHCYDGIDFHQDTMEWHGVMISDCICNNNARHGIYALYTYGSIEGCSCDSNGEDGIYSVCTAVSHCKLTNNTAAGITQQENRVHHCTMYGNNKGIETINGYSFEMHSCILDSNATKNIDCSGSIIYGDYNCSSNNGGTDSSSYHSGKNDITGDPQFVDAVSGDYTPRNVNALRGGKPDVNGNFTSIGVVCVPQHFSNGSRLFNPGRISTIRN